MIRRSELFYSGSNDEGWAGDILLARQETEKGDIEGYLGPYLGREFLRGYLTYLAKVSPANSQYQRIPEVMEAVMSPLLVPDDASHKILVFGQVARYIARGMDDDYWRIAAHQIESGEAWDPDLDLMAEGITIEKLSEQLMEAFSVKETNPDEVFPDRKKYTFSLDGFEIQVSVGKVPTADIHNMVISLVDVNSSRRLFHVDLSELTRDPQIIIREKRKGETSDWQDLVYATLTFRDKHIHYSMRKESKEVMFRPNAIVTESTDPAVLLENVFRAIRMAGLLPLEGIRGLDGEEIDPVDFGRFAPFFTSDSILKLHLTIIRAMEAGGKEISPSNLRLIQQELKLCMQVDPLWTIANLRDTTIGRLISGLSTVTPQDWDNVLRSDHFCLEVTREGRLVPIEERDWQYMKRQRKTWRIGVDAGGKRHRDGLERFVYAVKDLGLFTFKTETVEGMFQELWEKRARPGDIELGTRDKPVNVPIDYIAGAKVGKQVILFPPDELPQSIPSVAESGRRIVEAATMEKPLKERLVDARHIIRLYATGTAVEKMFGVSSLADHIHSLELMYDLLRRYDSLTPRLLGILYEEQPVDFPKSDPTMVIFNLKSLGLVRIYDQLREHPSGSIVPLEFYSLDIGAKRFLTEIVNQDALMDYLTRETKRHTLSTALLLSEFLRIPTIEALLSLREVDYTVVKEKIRDEGYRDEVAGAMIDGISEFLRVFNGFAQETRLFSTFD